MRLGEFGAAPALGEDTRARRRMLGEDHPDTLMSACNLAVGLFGSGEHQAARVLGADTLARRVLGQDHPETGRSAANLVIIPRAPGEAR